jgi:hypothetical protein
VRTWRREHRICGVYGVGSFYQTSTGGDTADCEVLVRALVNCRECELATALRLLAVKSYKCPIS